MSKKYLLIKLVLDSLGCGERADVKKLRHALGSMWW